MSIIRGGTEDHIQKRSSPNQAPMADNVRDESGVHRLRSVG